MYTISQFSLPPLLGFEVSSPSKAIIAVSPPSRLYASLQPRSNISFERLSTKKMPDALDELKEYVKGQRDKYKKYIAGLTKNVFTADIDSLMEDVHANSMAVGMMVLQIGWRQRKKTEE